MGKLLVVIGVPLAYGPEKLSEFGKAVELSCLSVGAEFDGTGQGFGYYDYWVYTDGPADEIVKLAYEVADLKGFDRPRVSVQLSMGGV